MSPPVRPLPLFLYGTLRDPDILAAVLGRIVAPTDLTSATASGCVAVYYPGRLYPALVRRTGTTAPGLLLLQATADDLAALDAFEGDEYRRGALEVVTVSDIVSAEVYWPAIAVPPSGPDWTLERWTLEHKAQVLARETSLAQAARLGSGRR